MPFDPERHHSRSIRLQDYDYSRAGAYFVTILVKDRACVLGEVTEGEKHLSDIGVAVLKVLDSLPVHQDGSYSTGPYILQSSLHHIHPQIGGFAHSHFGKKVTDYRDFQAKPDNR